MKRLLLSPLAAIALAATPLHAQSQAPLPPQPEPTSTHRNFDPGILTYAAFPALLVIILVIAASTSGSDTPTSP